MSRTQIVGGQIGNHTLTGADFRPEIGIYDETQSYAINDTTFWQGDLYRCIALVSGVSDGNLSNSPNLATTYWSVAEEFSGYSVYATSAQTFTGTSTPITLDGERESCDFANLVGGEILLTKDVKVFVYVASSANSTGTSRSTSLTTLEIDTGSGFASVPNFEIHLYHRTSAAGTNTGSNILLLDLQTGDKLRSVIRRNQGSDTIVTLPSGCAINLFSTKGERGNAGPPGPPGDFNWTGDWSLSVNYAINDVVHYLGSSYVATVANNNSAPPSAPWDLVVSKGDAGAGASVTLMDDGSVLPNGPHSALNFIGNLSAEDAGGGTAEISVTLPKNSYMTPIWTEENGSLSSGSYEWAYGNGANTPVDGGLTVYVPTGYDCDCVAMSLRLGGGTATVELVRNGIIQGSACNVTVSSGQGATEDSFSPLPLVSGDYINFRTTTASGTSSPCVVTAWLKYTEQ